MSLKQISISNRKVPAIGIGTWHMGSYQTKQNEDVSTIQAGINAGARLIDTAEMYGSGDSETIVGKALKPYKRENLFLISKILPSNASKNKMEAHLDASLDRLNTDYLDLYLYHWRGGTPLEETASELQRLKEKGKIKAWGVSNFDINDLKELWRLDIGPRVSAVEDLYNLENRGIDFDVKQWLLSHHLPLIAYSPLGGKNNALNTKMLENKNVLKVADNHHVTPRQILLAWVIRNNHTIAIPQTGNPKHIKDNVSAAKIKLSKDEISLIEKDYPQPNHKIPLQIL